MWCPFTVLLINGRVTCKNEFCAVFVSMRAFWYDLSIGGDGKRRVKPRNQMGVVEGEGAADRTGPDNKMGTYAMGIAERELEKPFYASVES